PGLGSESSDFARDMVVGPSPLQGGQSLRFALVITAVGDLHRGGGRFSFLFFHNQPPLLVVHPRVNSNFRFLRIASSISRGDTSRSLCSDKGRVREPEHDRDSCSCSSLTSETL